MATAPAALPAQFTAASDAILTGLPPLWEALVVKDLQGGYPYAAYSPMTAVLNSLGQLFVKQLENGTLSPNPEVVREANTQAGFDKVSWIVNAITAYYLNTLNDEYRQFATYMANHGLNAMGVGDFFALAVGAFIGVAAATGLGAQVASGAAGAAAGGSTGLVPISTTLKGIGLASVGAGSTTASLSTAASAGSLASDLGKAATALTGSSTVGSIVSDFASTLGSVVSNLEAVFKPIVDYTSNILKTVEDVNKSFIEPLTTAVSKDYSIITGTIGEVQSLAHAGIRGILEIPTALNSAFTQLQLAQRQLADLTAEHNTTIVDQHLVPGLKSTVGDPIASMGAMLGESFALPKYDVADFGSVKINEPVSTDEVAGAQARLAGEFSTKGGWLGKLLAPFVWLFREVMILSGATEAVLSQARQLGNVDLPVEALELGEIVKAKYREILSPPNAAAEAMLHGISPARWQVMLENELWLPSPEVALKLLNRGVITQAQYTAACLKQGLTQADADAMRGAFLEPPNPREAMIANGRMAASQKGFLPQSYGSKVPNEFFQLYAGRFASSDIAPLDWIEHWRTPPLAWFMTAYFRGLVSKEDVYTAAEAENIPVELVDKLIPVEQEIIQLWMIPDMIASGTFTEQEAVSYLEYMGIDARSAEIITKYGLAKAKGPAAGQAAALAGLSAAQARTMFEDGVIDAAAYEEVLIEHGYSGGAAALTVKLYTQQINLAQRKQFAAGLIKQYAAGYITLEVMQQQLYQAQFNTTEVAGYVIEARGKILDKAKSPSEAQIKAFWEKGLLDDNGAYEALLIDGWAPGYAAAFITLWSGKTYEPGVAGSTIATA